MTIPGLPLLATLILILQLGQSAAMAAERPFLHPLFTDHMVLQRDAEIRVWGWTERDKAVTVSLAGRQASAKAGRWGMWEVRLEALPAGGPYELKVDGPKTVVLKDVMIGDVWLCSGQSNMAQGVGVSKDAESEIASADWPEIRLYTVPNRISMYPDPLLESEWFVCSPETISKGGWGGFSAVAYYFGRHLHRHLKVPVGLIHSSWGGTPAEAWTSAESLSQLGAFRSRVADFEEFRRELRRSHEPFEEILEKWWRERDPGMVADSGWMRTDFDDSQWAETDLPGLWSEGDLAEFDGVVWHRRRVNIPREWAGKELALCLAQIDDNDITWFNGVRVGETRDWQAVRRYAVPARLVKAGPATIVVRMVDTGGQGGFYGEAEEMRLEGPRDRKPIPLAGKWRFRRGPAIEDIGEVPTDPAKNPHRVTVLYNGMIAPLLPFSIKGAIWYQGESNAGRWQTYRDLLSTLIKDWRLRFESGDFPFLIVQLANYMQTRIEPIDTNWARLREAQAQVVQSVENTGLAVAIDIGEANDIHPKNKQDVGKRLALAARALAYGEKLIYSGPVYKTMEKEGRAIRIRFDHAGEGLAVRDGDSLEGFAVAGKDRIFHWAKASIEGDCVMVSSDKVKKPVAVRYAWEDNPIANLVNSAGLPAVPFRTDYWDFSPD